MRALAGLRRLRLAGGGGYTDLAPLAELPLEELTCEPALLPRNVLVLRAMASLKTINGRPADEVLSAANPTGSGDAPD